MSAAAPDIDREMSLLRQKPENRIMRVVYRCRLCGAEYDGRRLTRGYLASEFANIVVGNVSGCASMRPHDIHLCDSGRVGLADLLGAVEAVPGGATPASEPSTDCDKVERQLRSWLRRRSEIAIELLRRPRR